MAVCLQCNALEVANECCPCMTVIAHTRAHDALPLHATHLC
jgi:hypothetical protein